MIFISLCLWFIAAFETLAYHELTQKLGRFQRWSHSRRMEHNYLNSFRRKSLLRSLTTVLLNYKGSNSYFWYKNIIDCLLGNAVFNLNNLEAMLIKFSEFICGLAVKIRRIFLFCWLKKAFDTVSLIQKNFEWKSSGESSEVFSWSFWETTHQKGDNKLKLILNAQIKKSEIQWTAGIGI